MGRKIETEGILETFFVPFLDLDTSITAYLEQPTRIRFIFEGNEKQYTPDFLVLYRDGSLEIIEVKPSEEIDHEMIVLLNTISSILSTRNIAFRVVEETEIKERPLFSNVSLLDYVKRAPMSQAAWTAYASARDHGAYEALNLLTWMEWLALVARGHIRVRIDEPLSRAGGDL
jgi:hypothetical protein